MQQETYLCCSCGEHSERHLVADMDPCGCRVCLYCLSKMEAARKDNRLRCKCRKFIKKHILYQKQEGRKRRKTNKGDQPPPQLTKKVVHHQQKEPAWSHAVRDPLRQFFKDLQQLNGKELKEAIGKGLLVTLQFKVTQSTRQNCFDTTILSFSAIDADGIRLPSAEMSQQVVKSFRYFHSAILPVSTVFHLRATREKTFIPINELSTSLKADPRLLPKCIVALATGITNYNKVDTSNTVWNSAMMTSYLASDLILRALKPEQVGPAVSALSFMYTNASDSLIRKNLAKCRVTTTGAAARIRKAKETVDYMSAGRKLSPRALNLVVGDNVNWKVTDGPESGTMKEMCLINHRIIEDENELHYDQGISRVPRDYKKDYLDVMEHDQILDRIWRPQQYDFKEDSYLQVVHMSAALSLHHLIPSLEELKQRDADNDFTVPDGLQLARMERIFDVKDLDRLTNDPKTRDLDEDSECETAEVTTLWKKNNIIAGILLDLKFSELSFIYEFMEAMIRNGNNQVEEFDRDSNNQGKERPISDFFLPFCGDNDPVLKMWMAKDADVEGRYKKIIPIPGIFHFRMETMKKGSNLLRDLVTLIIMPFMGKHGQPATEKNMSYFFNFSDSTEPERQIGIVLHACWHVVLLGMKAAGFKETTTKQMLEYVLERAEESPQDDALYILIKCWLLCVYVAKAERYNKIEYYFSAMRLALPMLISQHATNYVRTFTDVLKYWDTCDDRSRGLIRDYGFTIQTPGGINLGIDLGQEKSVRLVRDETGKIVRKGGLARAENAATTRITKAGMGAKEMKEAVGAVGASEHAYRSNVVRYDKKDFRVFVKTVLALLSVGAFQPDESSHVMEPTTDFLYSFIDEGTILDPKLLDFFGLGGSGRDKYCLTWHILSQNKISRTEKEDEGGVSLKAITATVEKASSTKQHRKTLATSVSFKELNTKTFTKEELIAEFNKLKVHFRRAQLRNFPLLTTQMAKKVIVKELVAWRKKAFARNRNLQEELEREAENIGTGPRTTRESRRQQLSHRYYSLVCDELDFDNPDDKTRLLNFNYELK